jgi:hypothetical protein
MKKSVLLASLIVVANVLIAQLNKEQTIKFLTNGTKRDWQYKNYTPTLGIDCSGDGHIFTFFANGTVELKSCIKNSRKVIDDLRWELKPIMNLAGQEKDGEWHIEFNKEIEIAGAVYKNLRVDLPLPELNQKGKEMILAYYLPQKKEVMNIYTFISKN